MNDRLASVAEYAPTVEMQRDLARLDNLRCETLNRCYAIPGYKDLPLAEKNRIYDSVKAGIESGYPEGMEANIQTAIEKAADMADLDPTIAAALLADVDWSALDPAVPIDYQELADLIDERVRL